jgi:hypothetical protein
MLLAIVTNQNVVYEEVNSELNLANTSYHSVKKVLYSRLLSKRVKIKI